MWRVTTNAVAWETLPVEIPEAIRVKIEEMAAGGFTTRQRVVAVTLPNGQEERQRDFTTLESAQEYADFINGLPNDLTSVVSVIEIV